MENLSYKSLMEHWRQACIESEAAFVIFSDISASEVQATCHIQACWLRLLALSEAERGAEAERSASDRMTEFLKCQSLSPLPPEILNVAGQLLEDQPVYPPKRALTRTDIKQQITCLNRILQSIRRRLQKHYRKDLVSRLKQRPARTVSALLAVLAALYLAACFAFGSYSPRFWPYSRVGNFWVFVNRQDWGELGINRSVNGRTLSSGGKRYKRNNVGLGTHAYSRITVAFPPRFTTFSGFCGIDDETKGLGSVVCRIESGNRELFKSDVLRAGPPAPFAVPVPGLSELTLEIQNGGDNNRFDHADWLDLQLK